MITYPYIVFILLLSFLAYQYSITKKIEYFSLSIFVTFCFIAFRAPVVGADTYNYVRYFTGERSFYNADSRELEPLFLLYNSFLHLFTYDGVVYLIINTAVSLAPVYYLIKKYSQNGALSVLLFFLFGIYVTYFVGLRQILSLSFILWGLIFVIENRKKSWIWFGIFSILAYFFHTSAVIVAVVYVITYFISIKRRNVALVAIVISTIVGVFFSSYSYLNLFSYILSANIGGLDRISSYLSDDYYSIEDSSLNIILRTSIVGIFVFATIDENKINHWLSKIYLFGIVMFNLFNAFPMISRANVAFMLMSIIVFTWVFGTRYYLGIVHKKYINTIVLIIAIYMLRSFIIGCINPDLTSSSRMYPYYFFFENYSDHPSITKF